MEPEAAVLSAPDVSEQEMKGAIPKTAMKNNMHRRTPEETESVCLQKSSSGELVKKDIKKQQIACDIESTTEVRLSEISSLSLKSKIQLFDEKPKGIKGNLQQLSDVRSMTEIEKEVLQLFEKDETATEKDMIEDLIAFYRMHHATIPFSPLVEENDVPLLDLYVEPPLTISDVHISQGHFVKSHARLQQYSYRDLFLRRDYGFCKNIFITAKAGIGKTAFAKRVCMTWCQAHSPIETLKRKFAPVDIDIMKQFELLFMLSLRDFRGYDLCDLDDMIYIHIITYLDSCRSYHSAWLKKILFEKTTLIVLDGLDEWTHPKFCTRGCQTGHEMPHIRPRFRSTVLTTTRPWKLGLVKLHMNQIDRLVEINVLDKSSSEKLVSNALTILNAVPIYNQWRTIEVFQMVTTSLKTDTVQYIPYILLQMICIWFDGLPLGRSKFEIYTTIVEQTISMGLKKLRLNDPYSISILDRRTSTQTTRPPFDSFNIYCIAYYEVLLTLGRVAFETLFTSKGRSSQVIDSYVVDKNMPDAMLQFCLRIGLLSLSRDYRKLSLQRRTLSFPHKSFQEYFAALFINDQCESVKESIFEVCSSLEDMLRMSNVFVFLCGFNSEICEKLVNELYDHIQTDYILKNCIRYTLLANVIPEQILYLKRLKSFQFMQTEIMQEISNNGHTCLCLYIGAVSIDNTIVKESYPSLSRLIEVNKSNIKSLSITGLPSTEMLNEILHPFSLHYLFGLQKLDIRTVPCERDLHHFLSGSRDSLICLGLDFVEAKRSPNRMEHTLSPRCVKEILEMKYLQSLGLTGLCMTHSDIEELTQHLSESHALIEITLIGIECKDHNVSCSGYTLDLSQHKTLTILQLHDIALSQLDIDSSQLETSLCGRLATPVTESWLKCLQSASNLRTFAASESSAEYLIENTKLLPRLEQLREISFHYADLGDKALVLSTDMRSIEYVWFFDTRMKCSSVRKLISSADNLASPILIAFQECTITSEEEFLQVKNEIKSSQNYGIVVDELDKFGFQTVGTMSLKGEHSSRMRYYQDGPLYRKLDDIPDDGVSNWRNCIKSKNAAKANILLQEGSLPDPDELQEAYIAFKDEDQVLVKEMCHIVEEYISQNDDCIVYTQASYQHNRPEKVIFVVYTTDAKGKVLKIEYPFQVREAGKCNEEGDTIIAREKQENLTFGKDDYQELTFCLRMHSPDLMEKHSNLMNTSVSHFKSSKEHGLIKKLCIVLYVSAKGFIPVCEEALPKTLMALSKTFPTDIREGRFASPTGGPKEEHKDLKCGCRIESARLPGEGGTIGGFVNHPEHGLCAITCAHVVLDISEFEELLKGTSDVKKFIGIQCFQPEPPSICGEVVDLRLFPGTGSKGGMDVAFVKVDEGRYPKTEAFPDILKGDITDKRNSSLGALLKRKLKYDNNAVIQDAEELENGKTVVKYGCTTNLTSGIIAASGTSVKLLLKGNYFTKGQPPILKTKTVRYTLNDQIEIHDDGMNFSEGGDSGSMVFITDKHNKLTALGILTCREVRGNKSYATPIWRVFEEIKSPIPYSLAEISNPVHQLLERLDQYSDQISKLQKSLDDLKEGAIQKT